MNNNVFLNDTLDNFNFSQNVRLNLHNPFTKEKLLLREKSDSGISSGTDTEVHFDDSLFLSESMVVPFENEQVKQHCLHISIKTTLSPESVCKLNNKNVTENHTIESSEDVNSKKGKTQEIITIKTNNNQILQDISSTENSLNISAKSSNIKVNTLKKKFSKIISKVELVNNAIQDEKTINTSEISKLSYWGLPETILENYAKKNLHSMFEWQVECLNNDSVLTNNKNLIYSAPTSAGKTLVAEILAIKTVFERRKKVIFILPFVSIVREKMYYFQDLLGSSGIRVEGFMGSYNPPGGFTSVHIAICTIEKANSLINRLLAEDMLSDIGAILVDEVHLLGDPSRGYLLELLLTKLMYISKKDPKIQIQIIGMSATLPNLDSLAKWLEADLYKTDFRPIPLNEHAVMCGDIHDKNLKLLRSLIPLPEIGSDTDNILQLCLETIRDSCSILIFCPTKNWCENLAQQIALAFSKIGKLFF